MVHTLPNFLVIGAEKSGTTWLHRSLMRHPDVFVPLTKEVHFFNARNSNLLRRTTYEDQGIEWYARFFREHRGESAVGEVTPLYLCDEVAPKRIRDHLPDARLICCLRNPSDRAYSHYWMATAKGHVDRPFEQLIADDDERFIRRGDYFDQLRQYRELFPADQLYVMFSEELFARPARSMAGLAAFLGIDEARDVTVSAAQTHENDAARYRSKQAVGLINWSSRAMRRHRGLDDALNLLKRAGLADRIKHLNRVPSAYPPMPPEVRACLVERYCGGIASLESLIGRRTPWSEQV